MKKMYSISKPTLILGGGISSSGKTTVFTKLITHLHDTFWINKDVINEAFMRNQSGDIIPGGITSDYYHQNVRNQSYQVMLDQALINIELGKHPIVEGNYNRQIQDGYIKSVIFEMFKDAGCNIKMVYCHAPEEIIRERMIERNAHRDNYVLKNDEAWSSFIKQQPILPKELEQFDHVKIDTNRSVDECVEEAINYLVNKD